MQTTFIISQIVFNITATLVVVTIGVGIAIIVFRLVKVAKELEKISTDIRETSDIVAEKISDIIDSLHSIPFLSFLFKKSRKK